MAPPSYSVHDSNHACVHGSEKMVVTYTKLRGS